MSEPGYPQRSKRSTQSGIQNRDINAANRVKTALELRAQMLTYDEIAQRCGYATRDAARKAILREMGRVVVKNVDELRDTELHMLNVMHSEVWQLFMDKKNKGRLFAVDRLLAIAERRARLMGLDAKNEDIINSATVIIRELPSGYFDEVKSE